MVGGSVGAGGIISLHKQDDGGLALDVVGEAFGVEG